MSLVLVHLTGSIISFGIALHALLGTHVVREGLAVVMDESLDKGMVAHLRAMLGDSKEIDSFHDFETRAGRIPHVDFHVVVDGAMSALSLGLSKTFARSSGPTRTSCFTRTHAHRAFGSVVSVAL